jgi:hypothetical protein
LSDRSLAVKGIARGAPFSYNAVARSNGGQASTDNDHHQGVSVKQRIAAGAALGAAVAAFAASAASASITVPSFTVSPSSPKAGATGVGLNFDTQYSTDGSDSVRDLTINLPKGLVLNPSAVPVACTDAELTSDTCPASSQIGTTATTAQIAGSPLTSPGKAYLVAPQSGEDARLGEIYSTVGGTITEEAVITGTITGGLTLTYTDISHTAFGEQFSVTDNTLDIAGTVNGQPFTKMPTTCGASPFALTATSWNDTTPVHASAPFQPTGCVAPAPTPKPKPKPKPKKHTKHRKHHKRHR